MKFFLFALCFVLIQPFAKAQFDIKDSSIAITSVRVSYAAQLPGGDLADRFGWNSNIGLAVDFKSPKSILFGMEGTYIFGNQLKQDVIANLRTSEGDIIDQNGAISTVLLYERGFSVNAYAGYLWKVLNKNPNSGILFTFGAGFLQHKVRIEHNRNNIPALQDEYLKGYDRLTNGFNTKQFIGYQLLSNSRLWNCFFGFEFVQGFTQSRRDWNIDEMRKDDSKRLDLLFGVRAGWVLPLYKRAPKEYYFN